MDPHTYPGRPWPLSTLTVKHTDLYMRRAYSRIQRDLFPSTIVFLGDLFDGGREWSTKSSESPDPRYHEYGEDFWQKEYTRFSKIFLRDWRQQKPVPGTDDSGESSIRIIASLPGNHDLGFGENIQLPVRERFQAYFGDSNRIDIIGNHTFVSLDTVSLSAMDSDQSDVALWKPTREFLDNAKTAMNQAVEKHLRHVDDASPRNLKFEHTVVDIEDAMSEPRSKSLKGQDTADIPTILLTHVPLDRPLGKPCGPLRERHPPTPPPPGQTEPLDPDEPNSLPSQGYGWQYQNTLSTRISHLIAESLGGTISRAFSGDDHDYCDVTHRAYPSPGGGIREITVKSISWAMGVRKPGFLLLSLWNDIDDNGKRVTGGSSATQETIQTHLCLLPDQISILIGYGILLAISIVFLGLRATYIIYEMQNATPGMRDDDVVIRLPPNASSAEQEKMNGNGMSGYNTNMHSLASSSSSSDDMPLANLLARSSSAKRPRSVSPLPMYGINARLTQPRPLISQATNAKGWREADASDDPKWSSARPRNSYSRRRLQQRPLIVQFSVLFSEGLWKVVRIVIPWYVWLLYH